MRVADMARKQDLAIGFTGQQVFTISQAAVIEGRIDQDLIRSFGQRLVLAVRQTESPLLGIV
jgi:hypothetical protein